MIETADSSTKSGVTSVSHWNHYLIEFLAFLAVCCWAANIVAIKVALRGFTPAALAQLRASGAALIFLAISMVRRRGPALRNGMKHWRSVGLLALSGVTFNQLLVIVGLTRSSVVHTGLIVGLGPVMVLGLSALTRLESLTVPKLAGMLVSFGGAAVLSVGGARDAGRGDGVGDLLVLAGTVMFAFYAILMKKVAVQHNALTVNTLIFGLGGLMMLPFSAWNLWRLNWAQIPGSAAWAIAFLVTVGSVPPYLLYAFALSRLSASRVVSCNYFQPLIAILLGIALLGERVRIQAAIGGAMILSGVLLVKRRSAEARAVYDSPTNPL